MYRVRSCYAPITKAFAETPIPPSFEGSRSYAVQDKGRGRRFTIAVETCLTVQRVLRPTEAPLLMINGIDGSGNSMVLFDDWALSLPFDFEHVLSMEVRRITFLNRGSMVRLEPSTSGGRWTWHLQSKDMNTVSAAIALLVDVWSASQS